ncbi:hypothetical protein EC991_004805 [Linnemannia zychae]|nr:hypothetical protein EC991_004805 [Linnemannia zychae]
MSMFTFNTTGSLSSSQGRSSTSSTKSNYVPSTYIAKQLQLEEEARRQGHQLNSQNGTNSRTDSTLHWRGPGDVLAPGYSSGPLGYQVPPTQTNNTSSTRFKPLFDEAENNNDNNRSDTGAGVGIGIQGVPSLDFNNTTTTLSREPGSPTTTRLYPNLHTPASPDHSSSPRGILRGSDQRQDLNKDEGVLRKSTSVRFNAANDIGSPRPGTPSIYNQNGASSPFFSSPYIHSSANLQSALKEPGKVDVLSHRAASTGQPEKNSSLGPALGSVSGTAQSPPTYSSPKMQNDVPSMRNNSQYQSGISGGSVSVFQFGADGNLVRQNSKASTLLNKALLDEDEDDKEKERYMPAILLSNVGIKGSKIEPFVDGDEGNDKSDWETNNSFQQAQSTSSRMAPHLIGEDAPPAETLFDIAKKEKYYSRQAQGPTFDKAIAPIQDTRTDTTMNGASQGSEASSYSSQETAAFRNTLTSDGFDSIITYGFPPEATSYILNQFRSFGMIQRYESGVYGQVEAESFNWLKIQYSGAWAARNAVTRHLKSVGKFIVGVHACRSFSARKQSSSPDMAMDTSADGDINARQTTTGADLTEAEAREVQAGVDTLLRMRAQGLHADVGHTQATENASTRARHTSLYESWSQGGGANVLGQSQLGLSSGSAAGAPVRSSVVDQGDDDMAYILSHSLTSGGSLARSGRGRGFERGIGGVGQDEFLRSRSNDRLVQDQEQKLAGGESVLGLESKATESSSVGFRPLFGQSESRGLNNSVGAGQDLSFPQQSISSQSIRDVPASSRHQQQQQTQQEALFNSRHNQHRLSLRRPLGESTVSDSTLFASTAGILMDSDLLGASTSSAPGSPFHVQKKQRLSSSLFAPSSSAPSGGSIPQTQFGTGRNRASVLIDNPDLVDEWGAPLSKIKTPSATTSTNAAAGGTVGGAAVGGGAEAESMITSVFNMAKKRLFWG